MTEQNNKIFALYTPLRNQLRKVNVIDSLFVVWGFSRNMTFNLEFPGHIEKPVNFNPNGDLDKRRYYGIPEFELEFLLKQILINSDNRTYTKT